MIQNYLKLALRNLFRHKIFSSITIVGFAIGMACVVLIALWINDELNYDTFNENKNSLYRVTTHYDKYKWEGLALTPAPLASVALDEIPELTKAMRIFAYPTTIMQIGEKVFYERKGVLADPSILTMFSFPLIYGDIKSALENKQSIIITQTLSFKYFDNENSVGKTIICDGEPFIVEGVLKDIPHNSHLQFDFIIPFKLIGDVPWGNMSFQTYVQLENNANSSIIEDKITSVAKRNSPQIQGGARFELQPLKDVHLDSKNKKSYTVTGSLNNIYLFTAIAFFVLCIACFNFINLTTAKSESRNKEIGIRKVIGANKNQLKYQFLIETILLTFFSLCIAILLTKLSLPFFNSVVDKELVLALLDIKVLLTLTAISVITGLLAGAYPAFYMSSLNPLSILKNRLSIRSKKRISTISTRKVLVVLQFSFSIALVISVFCIKNQFDYIKNKDLGFNKEEVIYIPLNNQIASQYEIFKTELLKQSNIKSVSAQNYLSASTNRRTTDYDWESKEEGVTVDMLVSQVDFDFFETLQLHILQGRSFSLIYGTEKQSAFIVNEAAVKAMGIENPIGKYFSYENKKGKIVGVVQNAHLASLHKIIEPQVFHLINNFSSISSYAVALVKIDMNKAKEVLSEIETTYASLCNGIPFEYYFLEQTYDNLYKSEQKTGSIISYFTILAIIISCLGLFGLVSFTATQRTKEIGIRKVNGAKVSEILTMLNKDFIKWVIIAFVIAVPIAWFAMHKWLENFAYKTHLSWWIFALAGVLALGVALLTVSWQSWRAATRNPVEALRYE